MIDRSDAVHWDTEGGHTMADSDGGAAGDATRKGTGGKGATNVGDGRQTRPKRSAGTARARQTAARAPADARQPFPIVGVGASAGGLEAFTDLLSHLPRDTGMAFVLIQHLAPKHRTILPEILSRHTAMPVVLAENNLTVERNSVYVIPPDTDMTIFHGRLNLMERTAVGGAYLPVDIFLRSLADDHGSRAIGVVLSGSASDGALGLAAVKAEGGITFAQDPATARYDGMPSAAIAANAADFILDPTSIAAELARLGKHPYLRHGPVSSGPKAEPSADELGRDAYGKIFVVLRGAYGVDFSNYRISTIRRRIERRMALFRMDSLDQYVDYLRGHRDEVEQLYHDVLIMVTEFFREPESYAAITESILPKIIAAKHDDDQIRIWVPGCATGEEPYSVALCVVKALKEAGRDYSAKIFATDISERDIDKARAGVFSDNKMQTVPEEFRHFFAKSDGGFQISKVIRDMCIFARHDVTNDPPFSQLDLVSCRNLLIYLGQPAQERVMSVFHYALRPGGYLVLGNSESVGSSTDLFSPIDKKNKIFMRRAVAHRLPVNFAYPYTATQELEFGTREKPELVVSRRFDPQRAAEEVLLSQFTPPGVVIDDRFEIVRFHGATDPYLEHPDGRASLNVLEMAREGLATDIRKAVEGARRTGHPAQVDTVRFRADNAIREVMILAMPIASPEGTPFFLLLFQPVRALAEPAPAATDTHDTHARSEERRQVEELTREMAATRDYCQSLVEDKEAALEELRAANEEIQSSNEELQSINEELETAKEELQSTNEELRTVNEELENRNVQLSRANDDLNNLLRAVSIPTIMVGRDLRVRRFTPGADRIMNLIPADVGRPITDIALRLDISDLEDLLRDVIQNITVREREIQDEQGRWHSMRIRPYQTEENRIEGAIITLVDIDEMRQALLRATQSSRFAEATNSMMARARSETKLEQAREAVLSEAVDALAADAALVLRRDDHGWLISQASGLPESSLGTLLKDDELPQARIAEATMAPVAVRAPVNEVLRPAPEGLTIRAMVVVPLLEHGEVAGVIVFAWSGAQPAATEEQLDFAGTAASVVALVQDDRGHTSAKERDGAIE